MRKYVKRSGLILAQEPNRSNGKGQNIRPREILRDIGSEMSHS